MRYLITGSQGQLAKEFIKRLKSNDVYAYDHSKLDITDTVSLKECIDAIKPAVIINTAAYNEVDKAENDYSSAYRVNAEAVGNIARFSERYRSLVVHFSSDYVFDGLKNDLYKEDDKPNPVNKYGLSKLEGERILSKNTDNYLIFRVSWVYGEGKRNFIYKFLSWVKSKKEVSVAVDEVSVPTSTAFIVENTLEALRRGIKGLWHLVPSGYTSRYGWAQTIIKILGIEVELKEGYQREFNLLAKRPNFSALSSKMISKELSRDFDVWDRYLYEFLRSIKIDSFC